jgi:hypothetical protein
MSLSKNSKFILDELELENSGLSQTNKVLPDREKEVLVYIDVYEDPASKLDKLGEMYTLLGEINSKKQQIVNRCNQAFNIDSCSLSANVSSLYEENVIVFSETGTTSRTIGVFPNQIIQSVAFGVIREDNIRVIYYPALEDKNSLPQSDNTSEGLKFPRITSSSQFVGTGKSTILSANSSFNDGVIDYRINNNAGDWGVDGLTTGSGWSGGNNILGNFYKLTSSCGNRRDEINTLSNEIANLRVQINNLLPPVNTLKDKKHGYQLKYWSYRRSQQVNKDTISSNNSLKNLINNPNNNSIFG